MLQIVIVINIYIYIYALARKIYNQTRIHIEKNEWSFKFMH